MVMLAMIAMIALQSMIAQGPSFQLPLPDADTPRLQRKLSELRVDQEIPQVALCLQEFWRPHTCALFDPPDPSS